MKDEDLTQLTRIIPLLKWSAVLFPNGISVLQDSKYTRLFFFKKEGHLAVTIFVYCFVILFSDGLL